MLIYFRLYFADDRTIDFDIKEVHIDNLRKIVQYCENKVDCRRSMQLNYFAEHFTSEQCLKDRRTACDNCIKKGEFKVTLFFCWRCVS